MFIQLSRPKATIERVEHEVAGAGLEIAELGREPDGQARPQQPAQLGDAQADRRRHAAHAFGEVPHRQPLLEELGAIRHQQLDAIGQRRRSVDGTVDVESAADGQIEGRCIEIGQAGEVLEERPAGHAGDGGDCRRSRLDVAGLDEIQRRLDQGLSGSQTAHDAAVLRT